MTEIFLIRHTQAEGNLYRMMQGHWDGDVTPRGWQQIEALAERFRDVHPDAVYSSDLLRAYNTARAHAELRGLEVVPSEQLREVFVGDWEGKLVEDILSEYGEAEYFERWLGDFGNYTFPCGECVWSAGARFEKEIRRIAENHRGQTVLIGSHAAVIRSFWAQISGVCRDRIAEELPFCTNAAYCILELRGDTLVPLEYSCDGHLRSIGITEYKG